MVDTLVFGEIDVNLVKNFGTNIPSATDRDGIALAQQRTGAGVLTLNGAGVAGGVYLAGFDGGRKITIYSAGNLSARTFTITGTDKDGAVITEDITGPNATTATGTKFFQSVTSISVDATIASDAEGGFAASMAVLDVSEYQMFILSPTAAESVLIAPYGADGVGFSNSLSLKINVPASSTITWPDGTSPSDVRVHFPNGIEPTLTVSGIDWIDLVTDGTLISGDTVWYATAIQDLKA